MRVLPADVYDTLELSALAFGGIGSGAVWDWPQGSDYEGTYCPNCAHGHAITATAQDDFKNEISHALDRAGIDFGTTDAAVRVRTGPTENAFARIPFAEWCAELGVVRGE